ncbi:family 20 glycosyl hydrolase [Stachybotrys elegans]|uniref:beta-N-acetylhexosaminidase n=1 Tax=Stachybotrys elegans TaxID=80388 RepID=A0A8K0SGQ3_9HYPO|nr:family 20 glycosyl hydrolase [Stachybotrys elegans]
MRFFVGLLLGVAGHAVAASGPGLPTVSFEPSNDGGAWLLANLDKIVVNEAFSEARDEDGMTLIPPTLYEFASTFAQDLAEVLKHDAGVEVSSSPTPGQVYLTIDADIPFLDAAGRQTSEGYLLEATEDGITITGASPLGVWWGTRTLIQQLVLNDGAISHGSIKDSPGWGERGMMLDVARHWYPPEFLVEMCSYMSFFKQNVFHIHLSDNLYNNVAIYSYERQMSLYSAFRLLSDNPELDGLATRKNESYTRQVWDDMQSKCAARGVTLLPEIEAPGHALPITQWRPEIGLTTDYSLLNISHPDTIPTMKTIWKTFLPWFKSKTVHIGADEYRDPSLDDLALAGEYTHFCNELSEFITEESGKHVRLWGTFPPSKDGDVSRNVSVQHWAVFEATAVEDWLNNGYRLLNSWDAVYVVGKWNLWYGPEISLDFLFHGAPGGKPFSPHIFDSRNETANAPRNHEAIFGHIAPLWNDYGPNATTVLEAYYAWRDAIPVLADQQWGGEATEEDYARMFPVLHAKAPAQNLDRKVETKTATIMDLDFAKGRVCGGRFQDMSGNDYHINTNCANSAEGLIVEPGCEAATPLESKGRNYTLSFGIKPLSDSKGPIFTGKDSALWYGNGTVDRVMMFSGESVYALNYTFPVGEWTQATLRAEGKRTYLDVEGGDSMEFLTIIGWNGNRFVWEKMAFEAPIAKIGGGGFEGIISGMKLTDTDLVEAAETRRSRLAL